MKFARLVLVITVGALALGACGSLTPASQAFVASKNCSLSATNVDYAGCDLAHADLKGLDLASDNFRRANLSYANLDGASVQGADLRGATTLGVITNSSTVCENATFGPCSLSGLRGV